MPDSPTKTKEKKPTLIGVPYDPDDERFAKLLDSMYSAGRKQGWNDCFRFYEKEINRGGV